MNRTVLVLVLLSVLLYTWQKILLLIAVLAFIMYALLRCKKLCNSRTIMFVAMSKVEVIHFQWKMAVMHLLVALHTVVLDCVA